MSIGHIYFEASLVVIYLTLVLLIWFKKMPSVDSIQALATVMDSKGGNILLLCTLSLVFFETSMRLFYWVMERMIRKELTPDNAIALMGIAFVTGTAFGGAFGSMLKGMSGASPGESNNTQQVTETKTVKTEGHPPPPISPPTPSNSLTSPAPPSPEPAPPAPEPLTPPPAGGSGA